MRALVTGAAGFIGSHLCAALLARGWKVAGIDDLSSGSAANLAALGDGLDFRQADVVTLATADVEVFDAIFHVDDAVDALIALAECREADRQIAPGAHGGALPGHRAPQETHGDRHRRLLAADRRRRLRLGGRAPQCDSAGFGARGLRLPCTASPAGSNCEARRSMRPTSAP